MSSLTSSPIVIPKRKPAPPSLSIGAGSNPYDRSVLGACHGQFFKVKVTAHKFLSKTHAVDGLTVALHKRDTDTRSKLESPAAYEWVQRLSAGGTASSLSGSPFSPEGKDGVKSPSEYFFKKSFALNPVEEEKTSTVCEHTNNKADQTHTRRNAFSACKSLLSQRLKRHQNKTSAIEQAPIVIVDAKEETPVQIIPRRRPALKTTYRAPEDMSDAPEVVLKMPPTPRVNTFRPRFIGPKSESEIDIKTGEDRLFPGLNVKGIIIQRSTVVTPTKQLPVDSCLRRKVVFKRSPLRQSSGIVDLYGGQDTTSEDQEESDAESLEAKRGYQEIAPTTDLPLQQRRKSGDLMISVIKKEFRREVLERRRNRIERENQKEMELEMRERPVMMLPRRSGLFAALKK